ncbi:MAG: DUF4386 domain-containing protein, partial [Bacteroidota bacterium]
RMALAYLGARTVEGVLLLVSGVLVLLCLPLGTEFLNATAADTSYFETLGVLLKKAQYETFQLAMISLSVGSFFLCYLLYQARLVPRVISLLGFVGYASLLVKVTTGLLGFRLGLDFLFLPGALFELALPLWLMVKGFRTPHIASGSIE